MTEEKLYLRPNVVIEPLICNWYAWSHLISPATAALNIVDRHLMIMESYLSAPEIHASAVANPKFRGGPFMDLGGVRTEEIVELKNSTLNSCKDLIDLASSIKELDKLLAKEAKGFGMEILYDKVPDILKGLVELYYDRNNNADFRFFESLLFKSRFYNENLQSISLWITNNDHRPFCLSTPQLHEENILNLNIPFCHRGIDALAKMKKVPQSLSYIKNVLNIDEKHVELFESFFTNVCRSEYEPYLGDKVRMRYFGHACILVETNSISILVDPIISYYGYPSEITHYTFDDLPDSIDYVLITHNHQDHILFETLLPLRHKIKNIVVPNSTSGKLQDPDIVLMFKRIGFENVISIGEMNSISFAESSITALPFIGEHSDLNILTKACYLVRLGEFKLMFMADSRIIEPNLYKHIHHQVGDVDVLFLGMECDGAPLTWLYGPLMSKKLTREQDSSRRLSGSDCQKGMSLVEIFKPKEVYVYAMGQEPWIEFISSIKYTEESNPIIQSDRLVKLCQQEGLIAERLFGEKELLY